MVDLGGITRKLESPALGNILGFMMAEAEWSDGSLQGALSYTMGQVQGLMKTPHFPDIGHVIDDVSNSSVFRTAIIGAIAGYVMQEIDIHPGLENLGRLLKSLGINAAFGTVGASVLMRSSIRHSGGADHGLGGGSHFGFLSGSHHSPVGEYTEPTHAPYGTGLTRSAAASPNPNI